MDISILTIAAAAIPVFALMAMGVALRLTKVMKPEGDATLLALTVQVLYPCLLLDKLLLNDSLRDSRNLYLPVLLGFALVVLGMVVGWFVGGWLGFKRGEGRRSFALSVAIQNYGYIPIPIMEVLFPNKLWAGPLFIYTLGVELAIWSAGVMLMSGTLKTGMRRIVNPITVSIVLGTILNLTGLATQCPEPLLRLLRILGDCSVPLGILIFGATLVDVLAGPGWKMHWRAPLGGVLVRLVLLPALLLFLAKFLPLTTDMRHVLVIQAAMPAAVFPLILTRRYGGHEATVMQVIVFTTIVSIFTIPFVVRWALEWVGS